LGFFKVTAYLDYTTTI